MYARHYLLKQNNNQTLIPQSIRVSLGTAIVLSLTHGKINAAPTTAYLMTYHEGKCTANCSFCPQARESKSNTILLSRVTWPAFPTEDVISALANAVAQKKIKRICVQALNYPRVFSDLEAIVKRIKNQITVAISVSCQPKNRKDIETLKIAGTDRIGIALDAATQEVFDKVKGKTVDNWYNWEKQFELFSLAQSVFGKYNVSTHIIVGLGETEKEAVEIIQHCVDLRVLPALFAFTPIRGTVMEHKLPPNLESYRRIQLARHLISMRKITVENISFNGRSEITSFGLPMEYLKQIIATGVAFHTSGCPDCNRPYYNERPSGPIYNYPKKLKQEEIKKIKLNLGY